MHCRKDGTKLLLGKTCLDCSSVGEPTDQFCWRCGQKFGEKSVTEVPSQRTEPIEASEVTVS